MNMNGIDIASYQAGINLNVVPCDFVIIKATQGTSYVNPDCDRAYQQAKASGKCIGVYHYASGGGAIAESDFFLKNISGYIKDAVLVLDWESGENSAWSQGPSYAKTFLDRIYEKTGVRALIYMSKSVCSQYNWSSVAKNHGLWVAQYANYSPTGYQKEPWTDGNGYGAWKNPAIFQYSSSGRLNGYNGNLDLNVAYMDREAWKKYAGSGSTVDHKESNQIPGNAANNNGLYYRTHVQDLGWLDPVHDGQVSGTTGYGKQVEALKIDTRKLPGAALNVKAHIQDIGWKLYKNVRHDTVIGTVGKNKRIEAIEIEASGLPAGKKLLYRTHSANVGWTGWIESGFTTGSVGMKRAIEAIQIKIV